MKQLTLALSLLLSTQSIIAQNCNCGQSNYTENGLVDGVALETNVATKRIIPYQPVREADIIWSKRVWSYIDLREKMNQPLFYPLDDISANGTWIRQNDRVSLWSVIRCNVLAGDLQVFSPFNDNNLFGDYDGDQLKYPVKTSIEGGSFYTDSSYKESLVYYLGRLGPQNDIPLMDAYGEPILIKLKDGTTTYDYGARDTIWYTSKDIVQYRIKEDWFFDKNRSALDRRIIAIAPVVNIVELDSDGNEIITGTKELFWLYFPHLRYVLNNYKVFNSKNDSQWMSFDDLFWKRKFHSMIYKQSNGADRKIESYTTGIEALMESERIKESIRNLESDVWQY